MYDFTDNQCRILKSIEKDALKMNHTAILNSSDIRSISSIETILRDFVNDGLFAFFKPLSDRKRFSDEELQYIKEVYGESACRDATKYGEGFFISLTTVFEDDWDYIARSVKAHDRVKLHNGVRYELKYDEQEGFLLRYYDYHDGYRKDVLKIYNGTAMQAFIEKCFKVPNSIVKLGDVKHTGTKNISQLIHDLKLPKPIKNLFFHGITRETVFFTPKVKRRTAAYDLESLEYLADSERI